MADEPGRPLASGTDRAPVLRASRRWQTIGLASGQSYPLPLTPADLADTTGLSAVHVNRALQALRHQGVVDLTGGHLTILNLPHLKALGEFRANYLHLGDCAAA